MVQVSVELCSSQCKPSSTVVKTPTLKSNHFEKGFTLEIRTTFSGPCVSKILEVGSQGPQVMILHHFTQSIKCMGLKSLFFRKYLRTYTLWQTAWRMNFSLFSGVRPRAIVGGRSPRRWFNVGPTSVIAVGGKLAIYFFVYISQNRWCLKLCMVWIVGSTYYVDEQRILFETSRLHNGSFQSQQILHGCTRKFASNISK